MDNFNVYGTDKIVTKSVRFSECFYNTIRNHVFQETEYRSFSAFVRDAMVEKMTRGDKELHTQLSLVRHQLKRLSGVLIRLKTREGVLSLKIRQKLARIIERTLSKTENAIDACHANNKHIG